MAEARPEIPNSMAVPWRELVEKYGPYFFTSSLAYMMAMAIDAIEAEWKQQDENGEPRSHSKIGLFGVDMASNEEYQWQKPGCIYFALLARSKGIEVGVPPESDLLRPPPLYGVSELDHARIKLLARRRELNERIVMVNKTIEEKTRELMFLQGAIDDMNWTENTWHGQDVDREFVEPPLVPALVAMGIQTSHG
jgi:hypothetical protein